MLSLCRSAKVTNNFLSRVYSSDGKWSSAVVRNRFIDYFVNENDHRFMRSSPLRPISDETIPFVNAGMVQFKSVLQGKHLPPATKVANSQKCARVGGKHNDLDAVGLDGYHHTFFEMLGNWSFGSCEKVEACKMSWELLTGPFELDPKRLYVTYFGGDSHMGLPPDLETKEIWRQLGVEESHILPFGTSDNFWEMGLVGPCGPCTEIHVDHIPDRSNAGGRVNAGFSDLTELWNIVFIQFNRNKDGSLTPLKHSHVDTGMGFERLVALLNGAKSNYDTDLFIPLIQATQKISGCAPYSYSFDQNNIDFQKDKNYRILADHARLLTVAIADGVFPHLECKLRWVLRRALQISDSFMGKEGDGVPLLIELSNYVADSLHTIYPEIGRNLKKVQRTILHEAEVYLSVTKEFPRNWIHLVKSKPELESLLVFGSNRSALAGAYRKMNGSGLSSTVSPAVAYHLYESHGMNAELIGEMAKISGKTFCVEEYEQEFERRRHQSMLSTAMNTSAAPESLVDLLDSGKVSATNDVAKYDYSSHADRYSFPPVSAKVVGILLDGQLKKSVEGGVECGVLLDSTNFYHIAGGQASDVGEILVPSTNGKTSLTVKEVSKVGNYVTHYGYVNGTINVGDNVITKIDDVKRVACMRNHTLAHLITACMQKLFDAPLQEKCSVSSSHVKMAYNLQGQKFTIAEVKKLHESIQYAIDDQLPVSRYSVNTWEIPPGTTLLPDESYPVDNIHIIDVKRGNKVISREACCGTHILNTKDIGKFCISEVILSKKASCVICALTGPDAAEATTNSLTLSKNVNDFLKEVCAVKETVEDLISSNSPDLQKLQPSFDAVLKAYSTYKSLRTFLQENCRRISYITYDSALTGINNALFEIHKLSRDATEFDVKRRAMNAKFVVQYLPLSESLERMPLSKYTRLVGVPIMLFALNENELKVRCSIPQEIVSENFNAVLWMQQVLPILVQSEGDVDKTNFRSDGQTLSVQSRTLVYRSKFPLKEKKHRCYEACREATKFISKQLKEKRGA